MSVYVLEFTSDTKWSVVHDDAVGGAHTGTLDPAMITYGQNIDGTHNHNFLNVTCPVCQSVSTHPVGGGAQPVQVQQMFVNKVATDGCPCEQVLASDPNALGESHVRLLVNRMDGPGRWSLG